MFVYGLFEKKIQNLFHKLSIFLEEQFRLTLGRIKNTAIQNGTILCVLL